MQDQKWHEIRLRFSKTGRAKYIGHLDVNRVMSRALRRAGIPLWFTEGYNPHAYMRFSREYGYSIDRAHGASGGAAAHERCPTAGYSN